MVKNITFDIHVKNDSENMYCSALLFLDIFSNLTLILTFSSITFLLIQYVPFIDIYSTLGEFELFAAPLIWGPKMWRFYILTFDMTLAWRVTLTLTQIRWFSTRTFEHRLARLAKTLSFRDILGVIPSPQSMAFGWAPTQCLVKSPVKRPTE